jgi:uncharacterized membrane protein YdjX (TVP38/TMEM64 family)
MPTDGIFRAILIALVITILSGALLTLAGEYYFQDEGIKRLGVGIVLTGGMIYFFFRVLGRREAKRRQALAERETGDDDDGTQR